MVLYSQSHMRFRMNSKNSKIKDDIFSDPIRANIKWSDIESLLIHLGAETDEGNGSRIRFRLNGVAATFHRPHPRKEASKNTVLAIRCFLNNSGALK